MPRVLTIFNAYLDRGGEEEAVEQISRTLSHPFEVRDCRFSSASWNGSGGPSIVQQARLMMRNPSSLQILRDAHHEFQPDVWLIHNVFPVGSAAIYSEARRLGIPVIQYLHNFRPFSVNGYLWARGELAPSGLRKNFFREIASGSWQGSRAKTAWFAFVLWWMHACGIWRGVNTWIANSNFVRERMIEAGVIPEKIFTLYYPFAGRQEVPEGTEAHYLFLGRLIEAKGIAVLFETWEILERQLGARTPRLLIAGQGDLQDWVAKKARASNFISYLGQISGETKDQVLCGARAIIAPSLWWEAFGLIAYDAYEYGKPILAARSGGLTETVQHGVTGLLHEPGNSEQLAQQIVKMESDTMYRRAMGREGNRWLKKNADSQVWRDKFASVFAHATGGLA